MAVSHDGNAVASGEWNGNPAPIAAELKKLLGRAPSNSTSLQTIGGSKSFNEMISVGEFSGNLRLKELMGNMFGTVSYTHLTLPTNREV